MLSNSSAQTRRAHLDAWKRNAVQRARDALAAEGDEEIALPPPSSVSVNGEYVPIGPGEKTCTRSAVYALLFLACFVVATGWLGSAWCSFNWLHDVDDALSKVGFRHSRRSKKYQKHWVNPRASDSVDLLSAVKFDAAMSTPFGTEFDSSKEPYHALMLLHVPKAGGGSLSRALTMACIGDVAERQNTMDALMRGLGELRGLKAGEQQRRVEHVPVFQGQMYVRYNYPRNSVFDDRAQVFPVQRDGSEGCPLQMSWEEYYENQAKSVGLCKEDRMLYRDANGLRFAGDSFGLSWHYSVTEPYLLQLQEQARVLNLNRTYGYPLAVMGHFPYGLHEYIPGKPHTAYVVVWRDPFRRSMSHLEFAVSRQRDSVFRKKFRLEKWHSETEKRDDILRQQNPTLFGRWDELKDIVKQSNPREDSAIMVELREVVKEIEKLKDTWQPSMHYIDDAAAMLPVRYYDELAEEMMERGLLCNWQTAFVGGHVKYMRQIDFGNVWSSVGLERLCPNEVGGYTPLQTDVFDSAMARVREPEMHHIILEQFQVAMCVLRRQLGIPLEHYHKNPQFFPYPSLGAEFEARVRGVNTLDQKLYNHVSELFEKMLLRDHDICRGARELFERKEGERMAEEERKAKEGAQANVGDDDVLPNQDDDVKHVRIRSRKHSLTPEQIDSIEAVRKNAAKLESSND